MICAIKVVRLYMLQKELTKSFAASLIMETDLPERGSVSQEKENTGSATARR
jgi:hypothetical protein